MFTTLAHGDFPPWHPVLVNFTAGLVPIALVFELIEAAFRMDELRAVGWWVIRSAAVITPFTALTGWLWLWDMQPVDYWQMPIHQWLGTFMAVALVGLAIWRGMLRRRRRNPGGTSLLALLVWSLLVFVQGGLGGSMVHGRGLILGSANAPAVETEHEHESHDARGEPPAAEPPHHHRAP